MPTVLALGGDETTVLGLQDILEPFGHVLVAVETADELLAKAATRDYDLALIDIEMRGLDGLALIRRLHELCPRLRIVAITAYPKHALGRAALEAGALSLMLKPYEIGRIFHWLAEPRP